MSFSSRAFEVLRDPVSARTFLAPHLRRGHVSLLLGAGVSAGLNLPDWGALVVNCEGAVGLTPGAKSDTSQGFMQRMDQVRHECASPEAFLDLVHQELYGTALLGAGSYGADLTESTLLRALGALVMSSSRGSVGDVFTLNFDDALEWYLKLHGFRTQVVTEVPSLSDGDVDVRIHHFHGFLPLMPAHIRSTWIVLTERQLVDRLSEDASAPWAANLTSMILSKIVLIVGTSMSDLDVQQFFTRAGRSVNGQRPLAFALGVNIPEGKARTLMESGIVPVSLSDYSEIPGFLFGLCQQAAED